MSKSTEVEISIRAKAVKALLEALDEIEKEQLKIAAQMSGLTDLQIRLARKSQALNSDIRKLMVNV